MPNCRHHIHIDFDNMPADYTPQTPKKHEESDLGRHHSTLEQDHEHPRTGRPAAQLPWTSESDGRPRSQTQAFYTTATCMCDYLGSRPYSSLSCTRASHIQQLGCADRGYVCEAARNLEADSMYGHVLGGVMNGQRVGGVMFHGRPMERAKEAGEAHLWT